MDNIYKTVYFHAVRRAMLENETFMKAFMDKIADKYNQDKLLKLDHIMITVSDNDLFDLIMGNKPAENFPETFDRDVLTEIAEFRKKS